MNISENTAKSRVRIIVSSYKNGSPIGPMYTAKLYSKALCESNEVSVQEVLVVCEKNSIIELVREEYSFAKKLTIVEVKTRIPILLRSVFDVRIRSEINKIYEKSDVVIAIWYPGIILNLIPSKLKKSIIVMMDSQAGLILSTLGGFNFIRNVGNIFRLVAYSILEFYIGIYSGVIAYVSEADLKFFPRKYLSKVIYPKLPMERNFESLAQSGALPPNILIPRPDPQLLAEFIEKIPSINSNKIFVLLNGQLDSKIRERVTHIKYVNNYLDFYSVGGLVVLLDKGGAGVTNRVLAVSSLGLPFIGTISSLRGHDFKFPNCLLATDKIDQLARKTISALDCLHVEDSDKLRKYVRSHYYENAFFPIKNSILDFKKK